MNDKAPNGGEGKYSAYDLDIHQIDEASRTDFAKVSEMETRRDGWRDYHDLMTEMKADLEAELPNLKDNFDSQAGNVFVTALTAMSNEIANHGEVAESNREHSDAVITEVKRVRPLIEDIVADRKLAVENRNELQSTPQDGSDAYTHALNDTQTEARRTFSESNGVYSDSSYKMEPPPQYKGPVYSGPNPETPLDDGYKHAYYPDDSPYRGQSFSDGGGNGSSTSGGSTSSPAGSTTSGGTTGPELQTGGPSPVTGAGPGPVTTSPTPNPGPGTAPPGYLPGGGQPIGPNTGTKPVSPITNRTTTGPLSNAKPTPGMSRPTTNVPGGRTTNAPMSGRTANNAASRSLLPNQRQAMMGKTPVSGQGRFSTPTNSAAGNPRGVTSAGSARPGSVPSGVRGGVVRGKPNAGFEESLYRNTRAGRTVPGVIGGRAADAASSGKAAGSPRVASAGKVIGPRKNKGKRDSVKPKLQSGSLTDTTAKAKKDTRHTWQRMPVQQSTEPPSGAVAISRNAPKRPQTSEELAVANLRARKEWRKKFYRKQQEPRLEPASELFDGTEGKVTRSVIRGVAMPGPVDRRDAGIRFSTYGWEDDA